MCMWPYIGEKAVEVPLDVSPFVGCAQVFHGRNGRHMEGGVLDGALQTLGMHMRSTGLCHEMRSLVGQVDYLLYTLCDHVLAGMYSTAAPS